MTASGRTAALSGLSLTILLTLSHAANDAFTNVLPVFLPTLQDRLGLGEAVLAVAVAVISLSSNVLQPVFGGFVDRWGRRRSAALGLVVGSTLMGFVSVVGSVWALFFVLAVGGLGSAVFHPAAASMARDTGARRGLSMSLFAAGGSLGVAVMPVVILWVVRSFGAAYVPLLSVLGVAFGLALFLLTPPQTPKAPAPGPRRLIDLSLVTGPVGALAAAGILRAMAFISFTNGMPLFLANVRGYAPDAPEIGLTLSIYSAAASAGTILAGLVEARFGRLRVIVACMLAALPVLLLTLTLAPGSLPYYACVALGGMLTNASIPLLVVSAQDLAPDSVAAASGLLMGFTWGTAGVVYIGFGALQEAVGIAPALALGFAFLLPAVALVTYVFRRNGAALAAAAQASQARA
mgnify:CR=1 FL=1